MQAQEHQTPNQHPNQTGAPVGEGEAYYDVFDEPTTGAGLTIVPPVSPQNDAQSGATEREDWIYAAVDLQRDVYRFIGGFTPKDEELWAAAEQWCLMLDGRLGVEMMERRGPNSIAQSLMDAGTVSGRALKAIVDEMLRPRALQESVRRTAEIHQQWEQNAVPNGNHNPQGAPQGHVYCPEIADFYALCREMGVEEELICAVEIKEGYRQADPNKPNKYLESTLGSF